MLKFIENFGIAVLFIVFLASSCQNKPSSEAQISDDLNILSSGVENEGKALWVICSGHTNETIIVVNGINCKTVYFNDHLTCLLPAEILNKKDTKYSIELFDEYPNVKSKPYVLNSKEQILEQEPLTTRAKPDGIFVSSCGFGDETSIWILCHNHTDKAKVTINGTEAETVYYQDHLTATVPATFRSLQELTIKINDIVHESPEFIVKKHCKSLSK